MLAIVFSDPFWLMVSKGLLLYALSRFMPCLALPRARPLACGSVGHPLDVRPTPKILINTQTSEKNPISDVPPPQASVATKSQPRPRSGTLPEGEIIIGGHLHHPGGHHDEVGVVLPRGSGFVAVAMCLIFLARVLEMPRS